MYVHFWAKSFVSLCLILYNYYCYKIALNFPIHTVHSPFTIKTKYRKVTSRFEAHAGIYRLLMKGIFNANVL